MQKILLLLLLWYPALLIAQHRGVNDKTIVLTFDDASQSHYSFIAPLLKQYGFGATFYVCEFPPDFIDSSKYMNWRQIQELSKMGFEIGNHTWHHRRLPGLTEGELNTELSYIEQKCDSLHIPAMHSFCYPAYDTDSAAIPILRHHGYTTARTGGDHPYEIKKDDPMYVPSYTIVGENRDYFYNAIKQTGKDKAVVFTVHGVPDNAHEWVTTPQEVFKEYLQYLYDHRYRVIAMKDLHIPPPK
jgi:peptidoglycan/xylan/chitin deacetylase (PgdA/CDA1 family)